MPKARNALFAFIAIFVVPLLFFVLLELGLTALGVGKSFDYFHKIEIDGQSYFQENPEFADQFYPASLNIGPAENTFAAKRSPDLLRVYILGESAALGFPLKNHGLDRLLSAQLGAALPGRRIEVINTAMTSVNSHVIYAVAQSLPDKSADYAVILMGNNEVVGPYGPGTFNQNFLSNINAIRGIQALKRTRTWQALQSLILKARPVDAQQDLEWEGMEMFTRHGVPLDDPRMKSVYDHYDENLVSIIETLRGKGMHVVLSTVPVNLRHSAPFLSVHDPQLSPDRREQWRQSTGRGAQSAAQGDWDAAIANFQAAMEIDPGHADTHFRLATALEHAGRFKESKAHYERAMDLDALRFRSDTGINQTIRRIAGRMGNSGFSFVDSAAAAERASSPFEPGWNLLLEHVHYDFPGTNLIAGEVSRSIVEDLTGKVAYQPLPTAEVARRVGYPNFDTVEEIRNLQHMIQRPPFPGQSNYVDLQRFLDGKVQSVIDEVGSMAAVVQRRQEVVESGLADWKVHFELAVLSQRMGDKEAAYRHLHKLLELYPHNREAYMKLAELLSRDGKWREVIPYLERSLDYTRGDETKIAETIVWLGTAYLRTGDHEKATDLLLEVTEDYPDQITLNLRVYGNLIKDSRERGRTGDLERYVAAAQEYGKSLVRSGKDKDFPLLHQRMSQLMTMAGRTEEAAEWAEVTAK